MKQAYGHSLLELVLVIVSTGALAAVSLPRIIDAAGGTQQAATESLAAVLGSAAVMNFTKEKAIAMSAQPIADCRDAAALADDGALPAGYHIAAAPIAGVEGASLNCTLLGPADSRASFRAIKVDPTS